MTFKKKKKIIDGVNILIPVYELNNFHPYMIENKLLLIFNYRIDIGTEHFSKITCFIFYIL